MPIHETCDRCDRPMDYCDCAKGYVPTEDRPADVALAVLAILFTMAFGWAL